MKDTAQITEVITVEHTVTVLVGPVSLPSLSPTRGYWDKSHYISRGPTGHWSKWGGARMDLIQETLGDEWACQSCGLLQPNALKPYRFEFPEGEYLRVCALCIADGCIILKQRIGMI